MVCALLEGRAMRMQLLGLLAIVLASAGCMPPPAPGAPAEDRCRLECADGDEACRAEAARIRGLCWLRDTASWVAMSTTLITGAVAPRRDDGSAPPDCDAACGTEGEDVDAGVP